MGYFKNKVKKLIHWAISTDDDYSAKTEKVYLSSNIASSQKNMYASSAVASSGISISGHNGGLHFTVYPANGGTVVQVQNYNIHTDQSRSALYVITDKEDLGQELGQIITVEGLSR
jgi:hypothetical protein